MSTTYGIGPFSGRVAALAYTSNYDNNGTPALYAGTAGGGVWRTVGPNASTTAGATWVPVTDNIRPFDDGKGRGTSNIGSIALTPGSQARLLVGTGEHLSADSGRGGGFLTVPNKKDAVATRLGDEDVTTTFDNARVAKVLFDPNDSTRFLAIRGNTTTRKNEPGVIVSSKDGVYVVKEGEDAWAVEKRASFAGTTEHIAATDLEYTLDKDGKTTWFAGLQQTAENKGGLWKSTDNGENWVAVAVQDAGMNMLLTNTKVNRMLLAASHDKGSQKLYAAVASVDNTLLGVFASNDNGATWRDTKVPNFSASHPAYNLSIGLSPSGRVCVGGYTDVDNKDYGIYESNSSVTEWRNITLGTNLVDGKPMVPHTDHHAWAFSPQGAAFAGNDGACIATTHFRSTHPRWGMSRGRRVRSEPSWPTISMARTARIS